MGWLGKLFGGGASVDGLRKAIEQKRFADARLSILGSGGNFAVVAWAGDQQAVTNSSTAEQLGFTLDDVTWNFDGQNWRRAD